MEKRKINLKRVVLIILLLLLLFVFMVLGLFFYGLKSVDKDGREVTFVVETGNSVNDVFDKLENENLIKSSFMLKIYNKLVGGININAGNYIINTSMDAIDIYKVLNSGGSDNSETVTLTFKEGFNIRDLISILEKETNITKDDVLQKLKDTDYLDKLINEYWFITDEIKNPDIYYSLEGYLFPNTYIFYKNTTIEDVFEKMLLETNKQLEPYRAQIENSSYTVHEFLTLASLVELESYDNDDRKNIAGVFINRLNDGWSLGSCVSTYYAFDINKGDRELSMEEIDDCSNKYNTRCTSYYGLPVGPIGNSGIDAILATLNPGEHGYYYFVSDKNMKTYFMYDEEEQQEIIDDLRERGLWLEYE